MKFSFTLYSALTLVAIVVSLAIWTRLFRRDRRLVAVYFGALFGSLIGAKAAYLAAEGWLQWDAPDVWQQWLTGKSILGALLGGYFGVEFSKWLVGYRAATGDAFVLVVPAGIALGRVGCLLNGCCLGHACSPAWWTLPDSQGIFRWPAVPLEILFNLLFLVVVVVLRWKKLLPGQHFHLYLIAYGTFRFFHEFFRTSPVIFHWTGYQILSLALIAVGAGGFLLRKKRAPSIAEADFSPLFSTKGETRS